MTRRPTIYLPAPADDLLQVAPSYLEPGKRFDAERLVERLGRRPSLAEIEAARSVRGMLPPSSRIAVRTRPEVLPMGPTKSRHTLQREATLARRREERTRRRQKREALGLHVEEDVA